MILPIYLPPGAEAPPGTIEVGSSIDPQRERSTVSVVLRRLDTAAVVDAAMLALRRVGSTSTGDGWRARRNYEAYFGDDGEPRGGLAHRLATVSQSTALRAVCEPYYTRRALALEDRVFVAACWLLWGEPQVGEPWGVGPVARDLAAECGVDVRSGYALHSARSALEDAA